LKERQVQEEKKLANMNEKWRERENAIRPPAGSLLSSVELLEEETLIERNSASNPDLNPDLNLHLNPNPNSK
jgi:hypothetical protein